MAERTVIGQRHAQKSASERGERRERSMRNRHVFGSDEVNFEEAGDGIVQGRQAPAHNARTSVPDAFGQQRVYCRLAISPVP